MGQAQGGTPPTSRMRDHVRTIPDACIDFKEPQMMKWARRFKDLGIEGKKARQYDDFSREYRMGDFKEYASLAASHVGEGGSVLEVATGPGYFCTELAKLGDFKITGLDISNDLVEIARANARQAGVEVDFRQGNASAMQLPDEVFDLVFCSWAIKNFMEPTKVLNEMYRVLKPGGTALVVDLNRDATGQDWSIYASDRELRGMTALSMRLAFTIQRSGAYSRSQFEDLIKRTPFQGRDIQRMGVNLCIYLFK
jgi:ubiquinone/menaquinone biosynthesis C-methylase UbiE